MAKRVIDVKPASSYITHLKSVKMFPRNKYWKSKISIVKRTVVRDGREKSYINVELKVGTRKMAIPLFLVDEIAKELMLTAEDAEKFYKDMGSNHGGKKKMEDNFDDIIGQNFDESETGLYPESEDGYYDEDEYGEEGEGEYEDGEYSEDEYDEDYDDEDEYEGEYEEDEGEYYKDMD
jgi:hypothetical protein